MKIVIINFILLCSFSLNSIGQTYSPTYFTRKEFISDFIFLKKTVEKIHPTLTDNKSLNYWNELYDSIIQDIPDSITFNNCYVKMSVLMSSLNDGHSNMKFPYTERIKYMQNGGVTPPFSVSINNNKIFIKKYFGNSLNNNIDGLEILSINNIESKEILKYLRNLFGAKKESIADYSIEQYFNIYIWMLYGEFNDCKLVLTTHDSVKEISIKAVNKQKFFELRNKNNPPVKQENYELQFLKNYEWAFIKIKTFADEKSLSLFLNQAFDSISQNHCKNIAIDIRDNMGGKSKSVDSLMFFLTDKHYSQYASISLRIGDEIKNKYQKSKPELYEQISNYLTGELFEFDMSLFIKKPTQKSQFNGNIFVLTNSRTYSAAATFAGIIKECKMGKIIGQPTGGTIKYYGDFMMYKLPNTEMEFFVSPKTFVQYGGEDLDKGVIPDVIIDNFDYSEIINSANSLMKK